MTKIRWGFESLPAHVSNKYTTQEFADKVDWEGGLYEAVTSYGLKPEDLDDDAPPALVVLLVRFKEAADKAAHLEHQIEEMFEEYDE